MLRLMPKRKKATNGSLVMQMAFEMARIRSSVRFWKCVSFFAIAYIVIHFIVRIYFQQ